jgi:repressor LexA
MSKQQLTPKQADVLKFIRQHWIEHQASPSISEVRDEFEFNSSNAAQNHIDALFRKGHLKPRSHRARDLMPVDLMELIKKHYK